MVVDVISWLYELHQYWLCSSLDLGLHHIDETGNKTSVKMTKCFFQCTHLNSILTTSFLHLGQTEGQKEGIYDQVVGLTFCSCDKTVYGDIEGTSATKSDEVNKVLKNVLTIHFADLSNQLSRCLPRVSAAMYSKRLISESVSNY